jgi:hypothetical protein
MVERAQQSFSGLRRQPPALMVNAGLANDVTHARKFPQPSANIVNIQQKIACAPLAR